MIKLHCITSYCDTWCLIVNFHYVPQYVVFGRVYVYCKMQSVSISNQNRDTAEHMMPYFSGGYIIFFHEAYKGFIVLLSLFSN